MSLMAPLAMVIGVTASLFLAWRSFRSHGASFEKTAMMAVAWIVIIAGLAFVLGRVAG